MTDQANKIEIAMANLNKQLGAGTVIKVDDDNIGPWPAIPSGALTLDMALGIGGLPKGRMVELYGPESSGKSTLALSAIAEAQKAGGIAAYVDAEYALDPNYAKAIGIDLEKLLIIKPEHAEAALESCDQLIRTGEIAMLVIDSIPAMIPKAELEGSMMDQQMGLQPRVIGKGLRKLLAPTAESGAIVIFINQVRKNLGYMAMSGSESRPGGHNLRHTNSVFIDLRRISDIQEKDGTFIGLRTKAKVIKNRMGAQKTEAEFDILFGRGINQLGCIVDLAINAGVLVKAGSWYSYEDKAFAQGRDNAIAKLAEDLDLADEIKKKVIT